MIFQCLGITGAILLFYGLIAFTVTQTSSIFLWTLIGAGLAFLVTFIIFALDRVWQKIIGVVIAGIAATIALTYATFQIPALDKYSKLLMSIYVLLAIVGVAWFSRNLLKVAFQSRSSKYGTSAAIYSMIVVFILIVVNIGSQDFNKQFDFTREGVNTLSDQTLKILEDLKEPVHITAFFEGQSAEQAAIKTSVKNLLDRYKSASKNIDVLFADPDKEKILADQKHAGDGDLVIEYMGQTHITKDPTEQGITQAILKTTRTDTPTVCFSSGHGEMGLEAEETDPRSLSILKASLANEGYEAKTLSLVSGQLPSDCSVIVIPSPQQRFPESEVKVYEQYLEEGGKLIALLDPITPNTKVEMKNYTIQSSGFEDMMKKWGIKLGNNLMLEKHLTLFQGEVVDLSVRSMDYGNHPVVDPLKGRQTYFNTVQSVQKADGFSGTNYELIKSAGDQKSWAETNIDLLYKQKHADPDKNDIMGPVTIAMAAERESPKKTQLLVFGDGDFVSNALIQSYEFNYDLFLNALNWMSGDVQRISIRPKKISTSAIELSPEDSYAIFYLAIITLPMIVLIFGINLWWYRRRRG